MPIYHFNLRTDGQTTYDIDGAKFSDLTAARQEAMESAREILANAIRYPQQGHFVNGIAIADARGRELAFVSISEVLPERLR